MEEKLQLKDSKNGFTGEVGTVKPFLPLNLGLTALRAFLKTSVGSEIFKLSRYFNPDNPVPYFSVVAGQDCIASTKTVCFGIERVSLVE